MALSIDVRVINPFLIAAAEGLAVMGGLQLERRRLFIKTSPVLHGEIAGVIDLSRGVTGSCVVSFPEELARRIIGRLLNEDPGTLEIGVVQDGIGEIVNLVAGGARRQLAATIRNFDMSTPTILFGRPLQLHTPPDMIAVACEFSVHADWQETFMVELATRPT